MKDYIKYSGENLAAAASQLGRLSNTMSDVADMLSTVDTSAGWWTKIGLRTNDGGARETVQAGRRSANAIRQKTENTISGIRKTRETFDEVERNIDLGGTGKDQSVYRNPGSGVVVSNGDVGAAVTSSDKKTTWKHWEALVKAIGGSCGIGKAIEGIVGVATAKDWVSGGKGITRIIQGMHGAANDIPKWLSEYKSKDFKQLYDEGLSKGSTWIFSGALAAFDTWKDFQNGRYVSTGDYICKWATKTVMDVAIKTTVKAGVTTAVTAGAAALGIAAGGWVPIAAGAITAVAIYGGDCLVKWASDGEYSGMTDLISDRAVKAKNNAIALWQLQWASWTGAV